MPRHRISPFLWYPREAEEAAKFSTSIFPDSRKARRATDAMPKMLKLDVAAPQAACALSPGGRLA